MSGRTRVDLIKERQNNITHPERTYHPIFSLRATVTHLEQVPEFSVPPVHGPYPCPLRSGLTDQGHLRRTREKGGYKM